MSVANTDQHRSRGGRIVAIDVARGLALLAMASYHFTWDLEFFGYADPGLTAFGGWKIYARCIASSFLFLVGVSLFLAHGRQIRWPGFWKRLAMVAVAALTISAVTWFATPGSFIFFGILHQIALASLLGLAFVRLPGLLTLAVAAAVIAAPFYLRSEFFDHPWLWWIGLSTIKPRSNDFVPLFPWFGAVLIGLGAAKLAAGLGFFNWLRRFQGGDRVSGLLALAGQHSLAFYLIHQPVLIACVWLFTQIVPPHQDTPQVGFQKSCQAACEETRDMQFCARYCGCMLEAIEGEGSLDRLFNGDQTAEFQTHIGDLAATCTATTDSGEIGEEQLQ